MSLQYPAEVCDEITLSRVHAIESWWCMQLCRWSPVAALAAWACATRWLLYICYLKPISNAPTWSQAIYWKPAVLIGVVTLVAPWLWRLSIKYAKGVGRCPWAAGVAILGVLFLPVMLSHPRVSWFFVEWAIVRTPNPSFSRNTLLWEQRNFERSSTSTQRGLVRLVGSSQIYHGTDLEILGVEAPHLVWEKNCLAGFGPLQYLWLKDVLLTPQPCVVVCWLSEFDFYREDDLPVERLRWASTVNGWLGLLEIQQRRWFEWSDRGNSLNAGANWHSNPSVVWSERLAYADLIAASLNSLWRLRDHFRRTVFHYWQDVSKPVNMQGAELPQLASSAGMRQAKESLKKNVGRKRMVQENFLAFERFAVELKKEGVKLVVVEGATHPEVVTVYDTAFRSETRQRLKKMADDVGFDYIDEMVRPRFTSVDFADPYHLNEAGRERFSKFLARSVVDILQKRGGCHASEYD